jgi:hypothetical protein
MTLPLFTRFAVAFLISLAPAVTLAALEDATFQATVSGDLSGGPQAWVNQVRPSQNSVVIRHMPLDLTYFQTALPGGVQCFATTSYETALGLSKLKDGSAKADYWPKGKGTDGVTDIQYRVEMFGAFADTTNWPPADGTSNTLLMGSWRITTEGKGQARYGCTGSGTFSVTILVERVN